VVALDPGAGFDAGAADESARAAERVDKDIKAAMLNATAEIRGTLWVIMTSLPGLDAAGREGPCLP
jgi:hypothetical protein